MRKYVNRLLFWTPRILTILFAVFISLFALDVFGKGRGGWETLLALLLHLIPTAVVVVALVVSWRWEWVGGVIYTALAVLYVILARGRFPLVIYLAMCGPLVLVGVLFLLNWLYRKELRVAS